MAQKKSWEEKLDIFFKHISCREKISISNVFNTLKCFILLVIHFRDFHFRYDLQKLSNSMGEMMWAINPNIV
jgi:hypothetical protein